MVSLVPNPTEANQWSIISADKVVYGYIMVYVDDIVVTGKLRTAVRMVQQIQSLWTTSTPTCLEECGAVGNELLKEMQVVKKVEVLWS